MSVKTIIQNDPRQFMYYNGDWYLNGTEVELSSEFMESYEQIHGKKLWKYARFGKKIINGYLFWRCKCIYWELWGLGINDKKEIEKIQDETEPFFVIDNLELEYAIKTFTKPIKMSKEEQELRQKAIEYMIEHPKKDWDYPELQIMWVAYIITMIGSLIFNHFYLIWVVASFLFFKYRTKILNG